GCLRMLTRPRLSAGAHAALLLLGCWAASRARPPQPPRAAPAHLEGWWADLAGADAARAYAAVSSLAEHPALTVPFLRARVRPARAPEPARLARLVADLDSDRFSERERAARELERWGEQAAPAL